MCTSWRKICLVLLVHSALKFIFTWLTGYQFQPTFLIFKALLNRAKWSKLWILEKRKKIVKLSAKWNERHYTKNTVFKIFVLGKLTLTAVSNSSQCSKFSRELDSYFAQTILRVQLHNCPIDTNVVTYIYFIILLLIFTNLQ